MTEILGDPSRWQGARPHQGQLVTGQGQEDGRAEDGGAVVVDCCRRTPVPHSREDGFPVPPIKRCSDPILEAGRRGVGFEMDGVRHQHTWLRGIGFCQRRKGGDPSLPQGSCLPMGSPDPGQRSASDRQIAAPTGCMRPPPEESSSSSLGKPSLTKNSARAAALTSRERLMAVKSSNRIDAVVVA